MRRQVVGEVSEKLYSSPEDALATAGALGRGGRGRYVLAAAFAMCTMSADRTGRIRCPWTGLPVRGVATLGDMLAAGG